MVKCRQRTYLLRVSNSHNKAQRHTSTHFINHFRKELSHLSHNHLFYYKSRPEGYRHRVLIYYNIIALTIKMRGPGAKDYCRPYWSASQDLSQTEQYELGLPCILCLTNRLRQVEPHHLF